MCETSDIRMRKAVALFAYCNEHHDGQYSDLYEIMSRLTAPGVFKPSPMGVILDEIEQEYYLELVEGLVDPEDMLNEILEED